MKIEIRSQLEWDNLPAKFEVWTDINIYCRDLEINKIPENSQATLLGNSQATLWGNSGCHNQSEFSSILLHGFAVCWMIKKAKSFVKHSDNAILIEPKTKTGIEGWFENEGIVDEEKVILFKRVSFDFKTQEGKRNETSWNIGSTLEHPAWNPSKEECGEGKFHACSYPYFCDEFRDKKDDVYIAIQIEKKDLYAWQNPSYPHKIAFRKGTVLYKCDKYGKKKND